MHTPQTLRALTLAALLGAAFAAHALPTDCKQAWPPAPQATASVTLNEGCSPLRQMLNPQPLPPRRGGAEVAKLNPQPLPPRRGGTAVAINPQPRRRGMAASWWPGSTRSRATAKAWPD